MRFPGNGIASLFRSLSPSSSATARCSLMQAAQCWWFGSVDRSASSREPDELQGAVHRYRITIAQAHPRLETPSQEVIASDQKRRWSRLRPYRIKNAAFYQSVRLDPCPPTQLTTF